MQIWWRQDSHTQIIFIDIRTLKNPAPGEYSYFIICTQAVIIEQKEFLNTFIVDDLI